MTNDEIMARERNDARMEKNRLLQTEKQCWKCKYRAFDYANNITKGCDYVSHTGRLRDKGNGPGDCRSFKPLKKETKTEHMARIRRSIAMSDGNIWAEKGKKI